jgi:hypothetical protein
VYRAERGIDRRGVVGLATVGFEDTEHRDEGGEQVLRMSLAAQKDSLRPFVTVSPKTALMTIWTDDVPPVRRSYRGMLGMAI